MLEKILIIVYSKGAQIGVISAIMKIMLSLRNGNFRWIIALTDLIGAGIVGHITYQLASDTSITEWQVIFITIFNSLNAFVILSVASDPKNVSTILRGFFNGKIS